MTWADLRPRRACPWEEGTSGAVLLLPRFGAGTFGRLVERLFHPRPLKLNLDPVGSLAWRLLDGSSSVRVIAEAMREELGERVEPAEQRLVSFLQTLLRDRLIRIDGKGV